MVQPIVPTPGGLCNTFLVLFRFEWVTDLTHCKLSVATGHGGLGDEREAVVRIGVGPDLALVH